MGNYRQDGRTTIGGGNMSLTIEKAIKMRDALTRTCPEDQFDTAPMAVDLWVYQSGVAVDFADAPDIDSHIVESYKWFMHECAAQFTIMILEGVTVEFFDDDPTPMMADRPGVPDFRRFVDEYRETGVLRVFRSQVGEHPLLAGDGDWSIRVWHDGRSETMNSIFRAVHDWYGHLASGGFFNWKGETTAYYSHARMFSAKARPALFSETVAQQCWYAVHRDYAPQKCVYYGPEWHNPPLV